MPWNIEVGKFAKYSGQTGVIAKIRPGVRANPQFGQAEVLPTVILHTLHATTGETTGSVEAPMYSISPPRVSEIPAVRRLAADRMAALGYLP